MHLVIKNDATVPGTAGTSVESQDYGCISPSAAGTFWVINTGETSEDEQVTGEKHMNLAATWRGFVAGM